MKVVDKARFHEWLESNIKPLTSQAQLREPLQRVSSDEVTIDGQLYESCWKLVRRSFFIQPQIKASAIPSFQFLRDDDNLYLGAEVKPPPGSIFDLEQRSSLSFRFNLASLLGNYDLGVRIKCEPIGGNSGKAYVDCGHYRDINTCQYASSIEEDKWSFEFSIPLREVMGEEDQFLFYKITLRQLVSDQLEMSFYPDISKHHDKQGNQHFAADFKNYLEI